MNNNFTFVLTARLGKCGTYTYRHDCPDLESALGQFWYEDYPEDLVDIDGNGQFPLDVAVVKRGGSHVSEKRSLEFFMCCFDHYFDKGWSASSTEPNQRYTFDRFLNDIERKHG